ncbi:MAG: glycosyltransferase family 39 protein [Dysgonamonadaceae bacterium]|jgi:hypothetical protein|nr:glycosyltransferase family 39 protein [Dysgonamonadaceae bacterium]
MKTKKPPTPVTLPGKRSNYSILILLGFGLLFLFTFLYIFNSKLDLNGDNFSYLLLAKSIAKGFGYTDLYSPGMTPASHFPPGYPAILAFFMFLNVHSIFFFKILNGLFFLASVCLLYLLMEKFTQNRTLSAIVAVLILLNSGLLSFATIIMSEMSYLFFTCLAIYAVYRLGDRNDFLKSGYFYVLVCATVITYYIRSIGIVLMLSILIYYLLQKRWKLSLAFAGGFFLLYLPWIIRNKILNLEGRYFGTVMTVNPWRPEEGSIQSFGEFFQKIVSNLDETVIKGFREVLFPFIHIDYTVPSGLPSIVITLCLLSVIFYGIWKIGRFRMLFIFYLLGNIATFLLWHGGNGARYVHPLTPFLAYFFFWGLYRLLISVKSFKPAGKIIPYLYLLLIFGLITPINALHEVNGRSYPPAYKNYFSLAKEFKKQKFTNPPTVCCRKPTMFSYYSECQAINYLYSLETNEVIQNLIDNNVDFVVLEQLGYASTPRYLYPAITANQELFEVVKQLQNPETYLLHFNREKAIQKLSAENPNP